MQKSPISHASMRDKSPPESVPGYRDGDEAG